MENKLTSANKPTKALHATDGQHHIAGIWDLHVMILPDDGSWFAQGLEIDYSAEGKSFEEAQTNFGAGLCATIHEHLKIYGTIENLLKPAPAEVWVEWANAVLAKQLTARYSQLSFHPNLPFQGITYFELAA